MIKRVHVGLGWGWNLALSLALPTAFAACGDGSMSGNDAGRDATGQDARTDSGADAVADTQRDAGQDAVSDVAMSDGSADGIGIDAGADADTDSGSSTDAGGGTDSGADAGTDAGGGTDSGADSGSGDGGSAAVDHLLISEVSVAPAATEFIEIYNAGSTAVDLTDYYLSDNAVYYKIAAGMAWNPVTSNPGTDFLVRFPAGATIAPGAVIVIAGDTMFQATFNRCPDYILDTTDFSCTGGGTARAVVVPTNGGLDPTKQGTLLSDSREMVILFQWDGTSPTVKDVDYVTWGAMFDTGATRVNKTGVTGYQPDTAEGSQNPAAAPGVNHSAERCILETGETQTGGNGITGHDETSEPMGTNFMTQTTPTPGVKNTCLP